MAARAVTPMLVPKSPHLVVQTIVSTAVALILLWLLSEIAWQWQPPIVAPFWQPVLRVARIMAAVVAFVFAIAAWRFRDAAYGASRPMSQTILAGGAAIGLMLPALLAVIPLQLQDQHVTMRETARQISINGWEDSPLIAANGWMYYWTDRHPAGRHEPILDAIADAAPGTLVAWDRRTCDGPHGKIPLNRLNAADWRLVWMGESLSNDDMPFMLLYQRQPLTTQPTSGLPTATSRPTEVSGTLMPARRIVNGRVKRWPDDLTYGYWRTATHVDRLPEESMAMARAR
jgi:hypothetical protein